jgi:multidrug efflux pump subunit AcrA (membrane-fusion protein)
MNTWYSNGSTRQMRVPGEIPGRTSTRMLMGITRIFVQVYIGTKPT